MEPEIFPGPHMNWNVEIGVAEITHSPCCKENQIVSGVSILNVFTLKNLFRALRSKTGRHFWFGFGTMNSRLKKARDVRTLTISTAPFAVRLAKPPSGRGS